MNAINMLMELPAEANILWVIGVLISFVVPIVVILLIARFRSFFASIWGLPFMIALFSFLISISSIDAFMGTYPITQGIAFGIEAINEPFDIFHQLIISLLSQIAPNNEFYIIKVLATQWFRISLYGVLLIIFFISFKKRKKKKSRYEEDF